VPCLSNLSSKAKLSCIRSVVCYSSSLMRFNNIGSLVLCCGYGGGGRRDVVVVIIMVVVVDVGSGA
ncbi:hypothetical protein Tco_0406515, partial [Tanacetum coccineum]